MSYLDRKDLLSADLMTRSITKEGSIKYYNSDKNVANIYMKLMATSSDGVQKEVAVDEASNYTVTITVKKPGNSTKEVAGVLSDDLVDETCAIYKFALPSEFTDQVGDSTCETVVKNDTKELVMNTFVYSVKADMLTGLNGEIVTDPDLPILKELIQEVKETAQTVNNIDNVNVSDTKTYSNKKIEEKFSGVDAQFNTVATKSDLEIEKKRLDNIIANNNNTEGNSELVDIRIGADGTVYDCAGKAVREQFSNNNSKIQESASKNIEQDTRLINIEQKNKIQDTYLNGLFSENSDGRLSINGEGNDLKLEGSKAGLVTVNSVIGNSLVNLCINKSEDYTLQTPTNDGQRIYNIDYSIQPVSGKEYTIVIETKNVSNPNNASLFITLSGAETSVNLENGILKTKIVCGDVIDNSRIRLPLSSITGGARATICNVFIFEGDYTNKPIPQEYFEGIQSSFEGSKVTQEMVGSGKELASNLGKYKVPAKVVGKNKFTKIGGVNGYLDTNAAILPSDKSKTTDFIKVKRNTIYLLSCLNYDGNPRSIFTYTKDKEKVRRFDFNPRPKYITIENESYIRITYDVKSTNIQLEEVGEATSQPTSYEPYFESTHNIYLNSPLLKGDVLECRNDGVYHVHNMGKAILNGSENWNTSTTFYGTTVSFFYTVLTNGCKEAGKINLLSDRFTPSYTDNRVNVKNLNLERIYLGDNLSGLLQIHISNSRLADVSIKSLKTWLQENSITVIYELAEPWEEKISDNKFLCEIANGSTLHLDSNIPVQSMKATYTSNVVSVVKLDKIQYQQDQINLDNVYRLTMLETTMGI